jgi:hypothetical protein
MAFITAKSAELSELMTPGLLSSSKESFPALGAQSPRSPLSSVWKLFQLSRLVAPPSIEK